MTIRGIGLGLGVAALACGSLAQAKPCPTSPAGTWIIRSYHIDDGIVAVSSAEMNAKLGKRVVIAKDRVVYAGEACRILSNTKKHFRELKDYEETVEYTCAMEVEIPTFAYGQSCRRMRAYIDSAYFNLVRAR